MNTTIVISHAQDKTYLLHCLDILEKMGIDKKNIWTDGYRSSDASVDVHKKTTHMESHGARCFDILKESTSEYVIIMDSDFFCMDKSFWEEVFDKVQKYPIVSIGRPWCFSIQMLTTPFVAYQRQAVLDMAPVRESWNHFSKVFPGMPDPVFDHLMFVFFTAIRKNRAFCMDTWGMNRKFNFCHLWDSRDSFEKNFMDFRSTSIDEKIRHTYLAYGVSKYIFHHVSGNVPSFEEGVWDYIKILKEYYQKDWLHNNVVDTMTHLEFQISFKVDWLEKFKILKERFERDFL